MEPRARCSRANAEIDALASTLCSKVDHTDVPFANAGTSKCLPFETIAPEIFDQIFATTFRGAYFTIKKLPPFMFEGQLFHRI